jgi:glycosyltransferase involved in cell wall biosynthesis
VVIAGDAQGRDSYVEEIRQAVAKADLRNTVTLTGHITDMPSAYMAADIVISTSTTPEAFGRIPVEAGAMERVVIATDHGGARETVLPGKTGLLVPPGDAAALSEALIGLMAYSEERRQEMSAKARAHVKAQFSLEKMCADTIALYVNLARSAGIS